MLKPKQSFVAMGVLILLTAVFALSMSPASRAQLVSTIESGVQDFFVNRESSESPMERLAPVTSSDAFHFLEPLAPASGDPQKFDPAWLNHLVVEVCEVQGNECPVVKRFTSQGTMSEQLRIETTRRDGSYYIVNWDTQNHVLNPKTFRIRVLAAHIQLGSIDLGPSQYNTFGRTWPIKFLIEKDPELRVRLMRSLGRSCSQAASVLKNEFNLGAEEVASLLANDPVPCSAAEIELALRGVYQAAVIPATTKISDEATRNALLSFDPITGRMVFLVKTALLGTLKIGNVIVSEPSAAAPNGYLRKVTATKKENDFFVLETVQASFNDAIQQGSLDAAATLRPSDLLATVPAMPGVSFRTLSKYSESESSENIHAPNVIGEDYDFETSIDVTLDRSISGGGVNGDGHVRIQGYIRFNAGYSVNFNVEPCFDNPPVCVDGFEAKLGVDHYSNLRVSGEFNGTMEKEIKLATHHFKPIVFFIGPVPVVIVPVLNAEVGANGEAHLRFSFAAELAAQLAIGAKWTEDGGWENISRKNGVQFRVTEQNLDANMKLRAYGKADGKLLFYGVAGPGFDSRVGGGADVQVPRRPWWRIFGYIGANITFQVDLGGLLKLSEFRRTVLDEEFTLVDAPNQAPRFSNVNTDVINVGVTTPLTLGPRSGFEGHFDVRDLEGDSFTLSASSNVDGTLPSLRYAFQTGGLRTITITATDTEGASSQTTLRVNVTNSIPEVEIFGASTAKATVQYFMSARAVDWETGILTCNRLNIAALNSAGVPSGTVTRTDGFGLCSATIIFDQVGAHTVRVTATDPHGGVGTGSNSVDVTTAPVNRPPIITDRSFEVRAVPGPRVNRDEIFCPLFIPTCQIPLNGSIFNGFNGDWIPPLYLEIEAIDPDGGPVTVQYTCRSGTQQRTVTAASGERVSCDPILLPLIPVEVFATVSDGVNQNTTEVRTYTVLDVPR